jgi:hypothetical protein
MILLSPGLRLSVGYRLPDLLKVGIAAVLAPSYTFPTPILSEHQFIGRDPYLSGASALRLHERIQQLPQSQFAITLGRPGEVKMAGGRIALHRIKPELFGGYVFDPRVDGFVASPEKAIFDLAYLTAMNRSRVSGSLPETDLKGLRWREVRQWLRRIPTPRVRAAVAEARASIRRQHPPN